MSVFDDDLDDYAPVPPVNGCARGVILSVLLMAMVGLVLFVAMQAAT